MPPTYDVRLDDAGTDPEEVRTYLLTTLGMNDDRATTLVTEGGLVAEDASESQANEIAAELRERGAEITVEPHPDEENDSEREPDPDLEPYPQTVYGQVTFAGERPDASLTVTATNVHPDTDRQLGTTQLAATGDYEITYEITPEEQVDLTVTVGTADTTLASSDPVRDAGRRERVDLTVPAADVQTAISGNELFSFMAVRPADAEAGVGIELATLGGESEFYESLRTARDESRQAMVDRATEFAQSDDFIASPDETGVPLDAIHDRLVSNGGTDIRAVRAAVTETVDVPFAEFVESDRFRTARQRLTDSLLATSVIPRTSTDQQTDLSRGVRIVDLIARAAETDADGELDRGTADSMPTDLDAFLTHPVALPEDLWPLPTVGQTEGSGDTGESADSRPDPAQLFEEYTAVQAAQNELETASQTAVRFREGQESFVETPPGLEQSDSEESPIQQDESEVNEDGREMTEPEDGSGAVGSDAGSTFSNSLASLETPVATLPDETLSALSDRTHDALEAAGFQLEPERFRLSQALETLTTREATLGSELYERTLDTTADSSVRLGDDYYPVPTDWSASDSSDGGLFGENGVGTGELPEVDPHGPGIGVGDPSVNFDTPTVNVLGIGDLKTVRRAVDRFEMSDVAHIENALEGEVKERVHEREEVTEETTVVEQETTEEETRDLRTSEQFEVERETEETVKEKSSVEAGVNITASYGPTVKVDAYTDYAKSQSREETKKAARQYSREVTERTVNRIKKRKLRRTVEKVTERVTETNSHKIDNAGSEDTDHVTGIYRWVDKVMKAQVFNHGQRLLLEFIIPEPAAFYRQAKASNPAAQVNMDRPQRPAVIEDVDLMGNVQTRPLRPKDLTAGNYLIHARKYGSDSVGPPPARYEWEATTMQQQIKSSGDNQRAPDPIIKQGSLQVKDGYEAKRAWVGFNDVVREKTDWRWKLQTKIGPLPVSVGLDGTWNVEDDIIVIPNPDSVDVEISGDVQNEKVLERVAEEAIETFTGKDGDDQQKEKRAYEYRLGLDDNQSPVPLDGNGGSQQVDLTALSEERLTGKIPITTLAYNLRGFALSITLQCERLQDTFEQWQLDTYNAIMNAYRERKSEYEDKLRQARTQEGITISGNNPEENRRIEQAELRKHAITLLRRNRIDMDAVASSDDIPGVDLDALPDQANTIQFFEQAFEWNNMTYVFYPYFWARRDKWPALQQIESSDPRFASFLKAGAARVVTPVTPGYNWSVLHYLATGELRFEPPDIYDDRHIPIVNELKARQGADQDATPVGAPWRFRVPTELVKLQQGPTLPDLSEPLNGDN